MKKESEAAGLIKRINFIENSIVSHHAKMIQEYCKSKKACSDCTFYIGACRLAYHPPSEWDIKEVEEIGDEQMQ